MSKLKPLARKSDIVVQEMDKEILIYDLQTNKAYNLNETSSIIWQLADGNKTITEIADSLTQKFKSPVTDDFVWLALEQLRKDKLIANETEIAGFFEGVSRREIIKKVGFASLVALPIVSSLVAPTSLNASSASCSTAIPPASPPGTGGLQCRCSCSTPIGSTCGTGLPVDTCNAGCTCTRTNNCSTVTDPTNPIFQTAVGSCG